MSIAAFELLAPTLTPVAVSADLAAEPPRLLTTDEFFALADDPNLHREMIAGELVESVMTASNARHSSTLSRLCRHLEVWADSLGAARGVVVGGDARCRLQGDPKPTIVGIDVAYFVGETAQRGMDLGYFDGPPVVAVEILSPSDHHGNIVRKIRLYLASGVRQVWLVDPDLRTLIVYRPDVGAVLYHEQQTVPGGDALPDFAVPTAALFA